MSLSHFSLLLFIALLRCVVFAFSALFIVSGETFVYGGYSSSLLLPKFSILKFCKRKNRMMSIEGVRGTMNSAMRDQSNTE